MMMSGYIIDKFSWHSDTLGNTETRQQIGRRLYIIIKFLQDNNLIIHNRFIAEEDIDENFSIHSDDLTDDGLAIMKLAYDKWLTKVDGGMPPENLSLLENALRAIKGA